MTEQKKVQFVCFETTLDSELFIQRWEKYTRSLNSDLDVVLQQSEANGIFRYIAQHRFVEGELQFVFSREGRVSRVVQERIKTTQAGGYSMLQKERLHDANPGEKKVFAFLTNPRANLTLYKKLSAGSADLNIYEPYYENCKYAYILEYFVKNKHVAPLLEQLKQHDIIEAGVYKKCTFVKSVEKDTAKALYVWPK